MSFSQKVNSSQFILNVIAIEKVMAFLGHSFFFNRRKTKFEKTTQPTQPATNYEKQDE